MNAAIAACVVGELADFGSAANGDSAAFWDGAENGDEGGVSGAAEASKGFAGEGLAGASKPKPSEGSAIWNGESTFRRSGNFTGLPNASFLDSAASSATVNGLAGACLPSDSEATENGES